MEKKNQVNSSKTQSNPSKNEPPVVRQHDEKIFRDGVAIFSEDDLRELINVMYSQYKYLGTQSDKLIKLINFLALDSSKFMKPELADQSKRLSDYLDTFLEFLNVNFRAGDQTEDGDTIFCFKTEETSSETEAFLIEFQMVSMDVEKAYKKYRKTVIDKLEL